MNLPLDRDFIILGDCFCRPKGLQRVVLDAICRWTGHLLWRSASSVQFPADRSIPVAGSHCRRCYRYGYVQGDYR